MALTYNNIKLIEAVANNDLQAAKRAALASLAEDKSKKNAWATNHYHHRLVSTAATISSMPSDMQSFLIGEAPESFDESRYFLRERDGEVFESVRRMRLIADRLSEKGIPYRNTTLLYGKSGTGKTELGRYIAHKLNLPFFYISFSSMIDCLMGNTAKNIRKVFSFCSSIPCVLMLDEVDCISMRRSSDGSKGADGELERTTIAIMQELDRLPNHVTLLAATNRLDIVDEALLRRFSIRHEVTEMSSTELYELAVIFMESTDTCRYIKEEVLENIVTGSTSRTPGEMMPKLIRLIGDAMYEENREELEKKAEEDSTVSGLWRVRYTWENNFSAEAPEEAIAAAKKVRTYLARSASAVERYEANRVEYM